MIDRAGRIRLNHTGRVNNMQVGNAIGQLLKEASVSKEASATSSAAATSGRNVKSDNSERCDSDSCSI